MTLTKNVFENSELYSGASKKYKLINAIRICNNGNRTYNIGTKIIEKVTLLIIKVITTSNEGMVKIVLKIKRKLPRLWVKGT